MSAYTKPVKECQDAAMGFRTMNGIVDSQNAQRDLLVFEHQVPPEQPSVAPGFGGITGGPTQLADGSIDVLHGGQHDTPKVARGTLQVLYDPTATTGQLAVRVGTCSGVCTGFSRLALGEYFIPITGLLDFYADITAAPSDDGSANRLTQQVPVYGGDVAPSGIFITTWDDEILQSGNRGFALAEYGFDVTVYGRHADDGSLPTADAASMAKTPRRPPPTPRTRRLGRLGKKSR